jgi:hypothetical protein
MQVFDQSIHTALSNQEVTSKVPGCKFYPYDRIHELTSVNQLLPKSLILYELARVGHFCCVFENQEGINFFDPLGMYPDNELEMVDPRLVYQKHENFTYLRRLLSMSNKPVIYNQYPLQAHHTSTCGMWCCVRMLCSNMTCDQFAKFFLGKISLNPIERDRYIAQIYEKL